MSGGASDRLLDWLSSLGTPSTSATGGASSFATLDSWLPSMTKIAADWPTPIDRAVVCGCVADRLGFAFAGGYQAALRALLPALPGEALISLCITEEGGAHPRAIKTSLSRGADVDGRSQRMLNGCKVWSTLSTQSTELLVAASEGVDEQGRNRLRLVRIDTARSGVSVQAMPATPFAPEIEHGRVHFDSVQVDDDEILGGDGYADYIKPFRTIEDIHVGAALVGYLLGVATEFGWSRAVRERLFSLVATVRSLALSDARSVGLHIALAGFLKAQTDLIEAVEPFWEDTDQRVRERWRRDVAIMSVASRARAARAEAAWRRVGVS